MNESLWIEVFKFQKDVWSTQIESVIERSLLNKTGEEAQDESLEDAETRNESSETRNVFTKPIFLCKIKAPVNLAKISRMFGIIYFFINLKINIFFLF